jgi:hypothetical protein
MFHLTEMSPKSHPDIPTRQKLEDRQRGAQGWRVVAIMNRDMPVRQTFRDQISIFDTLTVFL